MTQDETEYRVDIQTSENKGKSYHYNCKDVSTAIQLAMSDHGIMGLYSDEEFPYIYQVFNKTLNKMEWDFMNGVF